MKLYKVLFCMYFPQEVYLWLVTLKAIPNSGEIDEKGSVSLPPTAIASFQNGFAVAEVIRKVAVNNNKEVPTSLATIKNDASRSTKLTNWNFIWLALESVDLKMETRIKELILKGELALIVELVRQLHERDEQKGKDNYKAIIRIRQSVKAPKQQQFDIKKLNSSKDPQDSETSLQFLMLLLKASLGISVQQILGLFTNQNRYLAQVIVKGVGQNYQPIVLFYTLLIKHSNKLKSFYKQDTKDAEACLIALKPGFISKSQKVVSLTIDLFGKLGNIYAWFVGEGSSYTFFMGIKRHPQLKRPFWQLMMHIIKEQQVPFFTKHFSKSFQSEVEQVQLTTFLVELFAGSDLEEKLTGIGIVAYWVEVAVSLKQEDVEAQIIAFRFMGQLMLFMPQFIEQSQDVMKVFQRKWYMRTLPEFSTLFNELFVILQKLGQEHNNIASKIYQIITIIAKEVGHGDKRDYLVQNFTSLIAKFPSIPTEYLIQHLKRTPLSHSEFMLVCQCVQINQSTKTLISVGNFLKLLFLENPLINFYMGTILRQIVVKIIKDLKEGHIFIKKLLQQTLQLHASLQIKYKSKPKHQNISFDKHKTADEGIKQEQTELTIKQKWKEIVLTFVISIINVVLTSKDEEELNQLKQSIKDKLLISNNYIKGNNFKIGCKVIQDTLAKRFDISKQEQHRLFEEHNKKFAEMSDSMIRSYKPVSHVTVASRLKGPQNITKQFQQISQKRKQQEEQKKILQLKRKANEEKKRVSVKKELQITNLLRGQIGEAQLREQGFLERLIQQPKQLEVISPSEIEERQLQSIQISLKKYHKVLRHLFITYTFTMHSAHNNTQKFEDNQQRKQILTVVQLTKLMKDYRLAFLTNQTEISSLVRDINIKLMNKREVNQMDFAAFEQFIIQFCALIMTRNHTITITSSNQKITSSNNYKNQSMHVIVSEFFNYLKSVFVDRGEKVAIFEEGDMPMSKEQAEEVENYNKKVENRPDYILPKGFKKVSENTIKFNHILSSNISGITQAYSTAIEVIDVILSKQPFNFHVLQSISQKTTMFKVRLNALNAAGLQKERAMSTYIEKPVKDKLYAKRRSSSRGITLGIPQSQRSLKDQAVEVLNQIIEKVEGSHEKQQEKQKRLESMTKLQQLQKNRQEAAARKQREKQEQKAAMLKKQKEAQAKRRQQTQRFLQQQRIKLAQKRRKNEQQQVKKAKQQSQKESVKRQNRQKFKSFHQGQVQKIKKIEQNALQKIRKQRIQLQQSKEQRQQQRKRLKSQINQQDKRITQLRKETQRKINSLFQSQPIRKVLSKYQANLRAVFDFILQNTYLSLTEKKHNNQIIFQSWKQFLNSFELTAFVLPKDTTLIFKSLTKNKLVTKEYYVGLTFAQFQQALLRVCIKYRTIFNMVADKIKDNIANDLKGESKEEKKAENQFETVNQTTIKDLLKQNFASKDNIEQYGQISQVTEKTLLGLIFFLKVPRSKQGQEKRFRQVLQRKHPAFAHQTQWLKEKLNEQYSLEQPQKKANNSRLIAQNGSTSQVSIK